MVSVITENLLFDLYGKCYHRVCYLTYMVSVIKENLLSDFRVKLYHTPSLGFFQRLLKRLIVSENKSGEIGGCNIISSL